jgi:hypothetical protein
MCEEERFRRLGGQEKRIHINEDRQEPWQIIIKKARKKERERE